MNDIARWAAGVGLAVLIALAARLAGLLRTSGALAAAVLGSVAVAAGWDWGVLLVGYFLASNLLSRIGRREREARTAGRVDKEGARDATQVLANGGVFGLAALAFVASGHPVWMVVGAAGLAASAADTWATEIGTLSRSAARSIRNGRVVPPGTSGAVTAQGLMAAFAGAAFVASIAAFHHWPREAVNAALLGGTAGALIDSILGAFLQSRRFCYECGLDTEQVVHRCGSRTTHQGGLRWMDNDAVNALSTLGGALTGTVLGALA